MIAANTSSERRWSMPFALWARRPAARRLCVQSGRQPLRASMPWHGLWAVAEDLFKKVTDGAARSPVPSEDLFHSVHRRPTCPQSTKHPSLLSLILRPGPCRQHQGAGAHCCPHSNPGPHTAGLSAEVLDFLFWATGYWTLCAKHCTLAFTYTINHSHETRDGNS